ncbi:MAG: patatin-like phospholipase family protein [Acidobacteriota bacterium]
MAVVVDETQGVILSGGGGYGAYEVGIMKALLGGEMAGAGYRRIEPGVFTGTSVGAFNAAIMAQQPGISSGDTAEELERIWLNEVAGTDLRCGNGVFRFRGNPLRILDPACYTNPIGPFEQLGSDASFVARGFFSRGVNFLMTEGSMGNRALQFVDLSALISVEPFRQMLEKTIRSENLRHSDRKLRIVATNWETGEVKTFQNEDVADREFGPQMIMASAAIPMLFPPVKVAGELYIDGGTVMNTPLKCALQAGATTMHIIYLDPDVGNIPIRRLMNSIDTFDRVFTIMLATKINEDIETAAWINQGLRAMELASGAGSAADLSGADITAFVRVAAQIEARIKEGRAYKKLTIHRYHPKDDLGGPLGMLDFSEESIIRLIKRGYEDAVFHDCDQSKCIFPDQAPPPEAVGRWAGERVSR